MPSALATRPRFALTALAAAWLCACGPEHGFSGAWKQACDDPAAGCTCDPAANGQDCRDGPFVYALHVARYGDDVTGIAVRYPGDQGFDPLVECGCYVMQLGSATPSGLEFTLKLWPGSPGSGPGCPGPALTYDTAACVAALQHPPCESLRFDLSGDEDLLAGQIYCDDTPLRRVRFIPSSGKTRSTCLSPDHCNALPLPDGGPP